MWYSAVGFLVTLTLSLLTAPLATSNSHFGFARGSSLPIDTYLAKVVAP